MIASGAAASLLFFVGCSSLSRVPSTAGKVAGVALPDTTNPDVVRHFIDGSVQQMRGDHAQAILEFQDALRYGKQPAVFYAMAGSYSALGKHALAIENGHEAVQLEPDNIEYRRTLAQVYLAAFQLDSAARQYEEIVRRDSSDTDAWFGMGRIYETRRPLRALEVYETMLTRFGPDWTILLQIAELYNKQGQFEKAAAALQRMKDLDPANQALQRTLAQTYLRAKKPDEALRILSGLRELDPENLDYLGDIGSVYLLKKEYAKAEEAFAPILATDSVAVDAKIKIGQQYYDMIEEDSTLRPATKAIFERIRAANPRDWRPYWFLGALASTSHDDSTGIRNFRTVTELAPWNPDGWVFLASAYFGLSDFVEMAEVLESGRRHVPDDFRVNFFLGVAYNRQGKLPDAAGALEKARQINPKDVEAISELAMVYDGMKRHEESDSLYEEGLRIRPDYHLILNNFSYSLAERGLQLQRALEMATKAVEAQPNNASYLDTRAWVLYRLGRFREAEKVQLQALEKGTSSATLYDHLGDIYYGLDEKAQALEYWKKALKLEPDNKGIQEKVQRGSL
jgi:tetratricopeptide (TPR) repeat protein